jgi:hypothetical protein
MTYWLLDNDHAQYAVDWDVVLRIIRAYHRSVLRFTLAHVSTASDSAWYWPPSWSLPEIQTVEVDWERIRGGVDRYGDADFATLAEIATCNVPEMARQLRWMVAETSRFTRHFLDLQASTQSENAVRIQNAIESYSGAIEVARFVRDTSADGLMVGATIMTGGAGAALLGSASALKGYGKYQDTDSVGAAVMYGAGNFVFGAFKVGGATLSFKQDLVLAIVQAQWESGVALVEGKSLVDALATGSLKITGPFVDRFFRLQGIQRLIGCGCIPITITQKPTAFGMNFARLVGHLDETQAARNIATTVVAKSLAKVTQKQGVERGGKKMLQRLHSAGAMPTYARSGPALMESVTLTDDTLLTLAIVNMAKGIGHGL